MNPSTVHCSLNELNAPWIIILKNKGVFYKKQERGHTMQNDGWTVRQRAILLTPVSDSTQQCLTKQVNTPATGFPDNIHSFCNSEGLVGPF
jgi:hypothetical protein